MEEIALDEYAMRFSQPHFIDYDSGRNVQKIFSHRIRLAHPAFLEMQLKSAATIHVQFIMH